MRKIDCLVIHHSAGHEGNVAVFAAEHRAKFNTDAIGYHAVVGNGRGMADGLCAQGRPDAEKGVGVFGANTGKLHVCLVGQFSPECASPAYAPPTPRQLRALGVWLLAKMKAYGVSPDWVRGHREVAIAGHGTLCPGNLNLAKIRSWCRLVVAGKKVGPLDQFLAGKSSGAVSAPQARPGFAASQSSTAIACVRTREKTVTLTARAIGSQGELWVPLKELTFGLGGVVSWNPLTLTATANIMSPPTPPPQSSEG